MNYYIELNEEEIRAQLPFAMICETRFGRYWNTTKRRRRWKEEFTESERDASSKIFSQCRSMYLVNGVPKKMIMKPTTLALWYKIADFCASL